MPTVDQWASSQGLVLSLGAAQSWPILLPDTTRHCSRAHVLFSKHTDALSSTNPTRVWLSCDSWVDLYHWFQLSRNFSKTAYRKLDIGMFKFKIMFMNIAITTQGLHAVTAISWLSPKYYKGKKYSHLINTDVFPKPFEMHLTQRCILFNSTEC